MNKGSTFSFTLSKWPDKRVIDKLGTTTGNTLGNDSKQKLSGI
jgi:hypothetical protein